jgi:hypothetical protein
MAIFRKAERRNKPVFATVSKYGHIAHKTFYRSRPEVMLTP